MEENIPTFLLMNLVRVTINWNNDLELIKKFGEFQAKNMVLPAVREGVVSRLCSINYYTADDAEKIKTWLQQEKVKEIEGSEES